MADLVEIPRHKKCKDVEKQLKPLREAGWLAKYPAAHAWARLYCPAGCCMYSVNSTPKSCDDEAKRVSRLLRKCPGGI